MKSILKPLYRILLSNSNYFRFRVISWLSHNFWFIKSYIEFSKQDKNENFQLEFENLYPCLTDKTSTTPLDPTYFYQDAWACGVLFKKKPISHVDIGSSAKTIGILSQFCPVTMVDIRPIELKLPNLNFQEGTILNLPFETESQKSVSSLCVIEHIGLGRYGDPIDAFGSEKSIVELQRITQSGGTILFSVPVDSRNKVYFNAHRAFTRDYVIELFDKCILEEEKYIYGKQMYDSYSSEKGFGTGLFCFIKK
jgi:hypothetical protein